MEDVIQLLPDAMANKIAAGEVVQRPSSVVKELLENAVDAGSTKVQLIIKDAGKTLIQAIDNGCGMTPSDARLSFERHATSKIRRAEDLFTLRTMGFRGEALSSIAAIAQIELRTRLHAQDVGTRILIEGSEVKVQEPCQTAPGTSIAVKNIFYNIPARRNFLKTNTVEMRHINDEFTRIAIANPDVHFTVHHNGSEIFHLRPGNLRQRIIDVMGNHVNKKLVPVNEETDVLRLHGFVGKPEYAKKTRGEQFFFVNDRFIRSNYLHHAVTSAFAELISKDTFPLYIIFIAIDPANLDVNVHPTKQEIKFEDERLVYNYLRVTVRHALGLYGAMPTLDFDQEPAFLPNTGPDLYPRREKDHPASRPGSIIRPDRTDRRTRNNLENWQKFYENIGRFEGLESEDGPVQAESITIESNWKEDETATEQLPGMQQQGRKPPYQIHGSYIVSHIKSGFFLIDQQAAHERILYESFLSILQESRTTGQRQLFPKQIELAPQDAAVLREIREEVNKLGFDIQDLGQQSFVINGVPAEMKGKKDEQALIETLLEQYKSGREMQLGLYENIARSMARSAAIRRGQLLGVEEMQSLIDKLFACEIPFKSPSGRNCFLTFELEALEKQFEG